MPTRILIIEDNEIERIGLSAFLGNEGFEVAAVSDGQAGLDQVRDARPDVILLDMLMPAFDGWHFLRERRADPGLCRIPVLVVTGLPVATESWAEELGANGFVRKPIQTEHLVELLRQFDGPAEFN